MKEHLLDWIVQEEEEIARQMAPGRKWNAVIKTRTRRKFWIDSSKSFSRKWKKAKIAEQLEESITKKGREKDVKIVNRTGPNKTKKKWETNYTVLVPKFQLKRVADGLRGGSVSAAGVAHQNQHVLRSVSSNLSKLHPHVIADAGVVVIEVIVVSLADTLLLTATPMIISPHRFKHPVYNGLLRRGHGRSLHVPESYKPRKEKRGGERTRDQKI